MNGTEKLHNLITFRIHHLYDFKTIVSKFSQVLSFIQHQELFSSSLLFFNENEINIHNSKSRLSDQD